MLIDAGSIIPQLDPTRTKYLIDAHPNASLRPGQWVAKYVERELQEAGRNQIDYFVLTHFHEDHMGEIAPEDFSSSPKSRFGDYQLGGLTDVAEVIRIAKILDRDYPSYDYPGPLQTASARNYQRFIKSHTERGGVAERFIPGRRDQIKLRNPALYPQFTIQNLAASGIVWTGTDENTKEQFPSLKKLKKTDYPSENKCSLALRLTFGKFRYYSGGDLDHDTHYGAQPWGDIETEVAKVCGPVDVAVANHHSYVDACGPEWVRNLRAKVYVINAWDSAHPAMPGLHNMLSEELYPENRSVLSTAMKPENTIAIRRIAEMKSTEGHIHIRVPAGGDRFSIDILDSRSESRHITRALGPFAL